MDTELKLLAVIPIGSSFKSLAVIMVTPVAKLDKAALKSLEENWAAIIVKLALRNYLHGL